MASATHVRSQISVMFFGMKVVLQKLFPIFFAASVSGQPCLDESIEIDCDANSVPSVFKLGDLSCPCNEASQAGALKLVNEKVYVCVGSEWKLVQLQGNYVYGTAPDNPGYSCKEILLVAGQERRNVSNGVYWIRLRGNKRMKA